ncbi:chondroitin sulfate synthase 2 [Epargyreus clarus]|uniref:chondroitin sulfate synthase 2 n=1 Tax=Epargyreus clarus TaxID=520877 RepID=UPI003C2E80F5
MLSRLLVSQVKHNSYFLVGLALGLWLALAAVPLDDQIAACESSLAGGASSSVAGSADEFEPAREERPLGAAGPAAGRSVQRPRYYTTELGMRAGLLAGALSSEGALDGRAAALNATARLSPALRLFIAAAALPAARAHHTNVVAFTDTREMLKPFHALKYLADNYLEEYDFFFLVSDTSFVNARRLSELVSRLSVSQDVYMGSVTDDDNHYCSLDGGILLSNSVLRAVHGELDWCVRNSYSPHHHENIGRCVLHAAHLPCQPALQGESYISAKLEGGAGGALGELLPALADAVTAHPLLEPEHFYQLHAYVSRVQLERGRAAARGAAAGGAAAARRHPRGARNASWPAGLRADPGLAPPLPANRFDHLRWTSFNVTHAFLPDDHHSVAPLTGAMKQAVDMVVEEASAWARRRWDAVDAALVEGAWCWQPPHALRYRLLLRLTRAGGAGGAALRGVDAARVLGAARLAPARYVTESARVHVLLPLPAAAPAPAPHALAFLKRYETVCLQRDTNTALVIVLVSSGNVTSAEMESGATEVREAVRALLERHRGARIDVVETSVGAGDAAGDAGGDAARAAALAAGLPRAPRDALVLLAEPDLEFNEDFLNRVRMNTISGEQWFLPAPFARYAQFAHPRFVEADGSRPQQHTGRFNAHTHRVLAFYRADYEAALESWRLSGGAADAAAARVLAAAPLRALRAPDPAALVAPRPAPCPAAPAAAACLQRQRARGFAELDLGARHALAKLLLETQADLA